MRGALIMFLFMLLSACAYHGRINLSPEGKKVAYIGKDLAMILPGRPLDHCKIIGHLNLFPINSRPPRDTDRIQSDSR